MKLRHLLLVAFSAAFIGPPAHADVLASYGFAGSNNTQRAAPTAAVADLSAGSFSFASGLTTSTGFSTATDGNLFARVNGTSAPGPADAITGNQYVSVTLTPNGAVVGPPGNSLSMKGIAVDASTIQLLLAGTPGMPYRVYRSNDLQGPLYRKRWSERFVGAFPAGVSEVPLSESMGTEPRGFFVATQSEPKARILCLGDSITEGNETMVVYKGPLYDKLTTAGYRFEYVGSKTSSYTSPTYGSLTLKHEGYSGKNCTEIAGFFATNSPLYPADIVIIHAAHNLNIAEAVLTPTAEAAIVMTVENATRSMIQTARTTNPAVRILLAKAITSGKLPKYSYIPAVNTRLGEIAD